MIYRIKRQNTEIKGEIKIVPSKSESNRVLIIRALCNKNIKINNLSDSEDTQILSNALDLIKSSSGNDLTLIDIGNCGTAMRFLTALLSIKNGRYLLTGSERMKQRPIGLLVNSLLSLDAKINYTEKQGYPPLLIEGAELQNDNIELSANVSSQFVSALLMIAPSLPNGLTVILKDKILSKPYIRMTLEIMKYFGVSHSWENNIIKIKPQTYIPKDFNINGDWSAASYWYELAAFSDRADISIHGLSKTGIQGDEIISDIFENFGITTICDSQGISSIKRKGRAQGTEHEAQFKFDFTNNPDLAQTLAVTCAGLNMDAELTGLDNLSIKETDRVEALYKELSSLGFSISKKNIETLHIRTTHYAIPNTQYPVNTYNDHRMALAFAPLALKTGLISIQNPNVVNKSYPDFWNHLKNLGFLIEELND